MASAPARVRNKKVGSKERSVLVKSVLIAAVIVILVFIDSGFGFFSAFASTVESKGKWQAVFLPNNQVYFGRLSPYGFRYLKLENVYYISSRQVPVAPTDATDENAQPQYETRNELARITGDFHGPEDAMIIPREQVLFWQNLRSDSPIVRTILSQGR